MFNGKKVVKKQQQRNPVLLSTVSKLVSHKATRLFTTVPSLIPEKITRATEQSADWLMLVIGHLNQLSRAIKALKSSVPVRFSHYCNFFFWF